MVEEEQLFPEIKVPCRQDFLAHDYTHPLQFDYYCIMTPMPSWYWLPSGPRYLQSPDKSLMMKKAKDAEGKGVRTLFTMAGKKKN